MFSVALIGGDGAGKTTVANAIIKSSGLPMKYVYMGLSTRSSNFALPTSRLVLFLKKWLYRKHTRNGARQPDIEPPASELEYADNEHGWLWNSARFLNRLGEAWFRQIISLSYQLRGKVVLYDRHFFFDADPGVSVSQNQNILWVDRLFFWLMTHLYPKPTLAIFLDAPPDLLFSRKGEASPEYLEQQRRAFLEQGKKLRHFIQVDASKPLDQVIDAVTQHIMSFYALRAAQHSRPATHGKIAAK